MNDKITLRDIVIGASGKDEDGLNASACGLFFEKIDINGNSTIINEVDVDKPIINIFQSLKRIQVDIVYSMKNDIDLLMMVDLLNKATIADNSINDKTGTFPLISLSIIPHKFDGKYYILCSDPIVWCLTAQDPRGELDTLRFVFEEDDFNILATSDEALSMIDAEIDAEIEQEEETKDWYEKKAAEEKAFKEKAAQDAIDQQKKPTRYEF